MSEPVPDSVVEMNVDLLRSRSAVGLIKYGVTLDRDDLRPAQWLTHMHEELLDSVNYCLRAKQVVEDMEAKFREACDRIYDMLLQDDGQAFSEAERFLKANAPDLYNKIGTNND